MRKFVFPYISPWRKYFGLIVGTIGVLYLCKISVDAIYGNNPNPLNGLLNTVVIFIVLYSFWEFMDFWIDLKPLAYYDDDIICICCSKNQFGALKWGDIKEVKTWKSALVFTLKKPIGGLQEKELNQESFQKYIKGEEISFPIPAAFLRFSNVEKLKLLINEKIQG